MGESQYGKESTKVGGGEKVCSCPTPEGEGKGETAKKEFSLKKAIKLFRSQVVELLIMLNGFMIKYQFEYKKPTRKAINECLKFVGELIAKFLLILPDISGDVMNSPYWPGVVSKISLAANQVGNLISSNFNNRRSAEQIEYAAKYAEKCSPQFKPTELTDEIIIQDAMSLEQGGSMPPGYAQFVKDEIERKKRELAEEKARQDAEEAKKADERTRLYEENKKAEEEKRKLAAEEAWDALVKEYGPNSRDPLNFTEGDKMLFLAKYNWSHSEAELVVTKLARSRG